MRLEQLSYILAVSEHGSLSKAAVHLYISPPALSMSISSLERELGFHIFKRTSKGLELTEKGKLVIEKAASVIRDTDEIKAMSFPAESGSCQSITLTSISTTTNNVLLKAIARFNKLYPKCKVSIDEQPVPMVLQAVASGACDIAVSYYEYNNLGAFEKYCKENHVYWELMYYDYLVPYVNKNHLLTKKKDLTADDLKNYKSATTTYRINEKNNVCYNNALDTNYSASFRNLEGLKLMIAESDLIAYLPRVLIYNDYFVKSGAIVPLDIQENKFKLFHYIAYLEDQTLSQEAGCLLSEIRRIYNLMNTSENEEKAKE